MSVQALVKEYHRWLAEQTSVKSIGDWAEVTTPFLDRHNDALQIYIKQDGDAYLLTDDGYVLSDLASSGCDVYTPKREGILRETLNGFGVEIFDNALRVRATVADFALKKHLLVQAMLAVDDLFYLAAPVVSSLFLEDVEKWLTDSSVRYVPRVKFHGQSGYDHIFDFVIAKYQKHPERIVQAINRPSREAAQRLIMAWYDTRAARPSGAVAYAVLNDRDAAVSDKVANAFSKYEIHPVLWSEREARVPELAA